MVKKNRTILYSNIRLASLPVVFWYLVTGKQVRYFRMQPGPEKIFRFLKATPESLSMIRDEKDGFFDRISLQNSVLDLIEKQSSGFFSGNANISRISGLFGSPEILLAYKKVAATELHLAIYRIWTAEKFVSRSREKTDCLWIPDVSDTLIRHFPDAGEIAGIRLSGLREPVWVPFIHSAYTLADRIRSLIYILAFPVWILCKIGIPSIKQPDIRKYETAIRIYKEDLAFHYSHRSIDFLVDDDLIKRENTLFCIDGEIGEPYKDELEKRGSNCIFMNRILGQAGLRFILDTGIKKIFPVWCSLLLWFWRDPWFFNKLALELLNKYLIWQRFFCCFAIRHYVAYNDTTPAQAGRNILFSHRGIQSWYYVHSVHSYDVFTPKGMRMFREIEFSYMNFTHLVGWGNNVERYYRACPNANENYNTVGCLWSQHVSEAQHTGLTISPKCNALSPEHQKDRINSLRKTIGIFDTSFGGGAPLDEQDMILFIRDMLALAADFPDIRFVYKNKYLMENISQSRPELKPYFEEIRSHPSFHFCDEMNRDPADIIAASDLTISLVFTSPTIEALGAGKKAVYYDPSGRFRNTYYDRFPQLVAHDYEHLMTIVRHWLECVTDAEFDRYLTTYVRGELDAYVDGRAITRFRQLLAAGTYSE